MVVAFWHPNHRPPFSSQPIHRKKPLTLLPINQCSPRSDEAIILLPGWVPLWRKFLPNNPTWSGWMYQCSCQSVPSPHSHRQHWATCWHTSMTALSPQWSRTWVTMQRLLHGLGTLVLGPAQGLGYCDALKHSIPMTTDKPVYLPHRQIPVQLQSEVCKCLDNWLKQGIIRPSKSPYASQVVIVRKKTGEICLCVDFRKLNAISIHDSFPLPCVEEALQAVKQRFGSPVSTWHKDTFRWPWRSRISQKQLSVQVQAVSMNSLVCPLAWPMQEPPSAV